MSVTMDRLGTPIQTGKNFADVVSWLDQGDCVILHNSYTRQREIFHRCLKPLWFWQGPPDVSLEAMRVIYINIINDKDALEAWTPLLLERGISHCICSLRAKVLESRGIPYCYKLRVR